MFGDIKTSLCYQIPEKVKCDEMFFLPKTLQGPPLEGAEAAEAIWVARCKLDAKDANGKEKTYKNTDIFKSCKKSKLANCIKVRLKLEST